MTAYEASLVKAMLDALPDENRPVAPEYVRMVDDCGCLEFDTHGNPEPVRQVVEAALPRPHPDFPIEVVLSVRGHVVCWLEFIRNDGAPATMPPVEDFRVIPLIASV